MMQKKEWQNLNKSIPIYNNNPHNANKCVMRAFYLKDYKLVENNIINDCRYLKMRMRV